MLEIEKLTVQFGDRRVLDEVSMSVSRGEVLGIVGESGSGKTMTALSIMGLLNPAAEITNGSISLDGKVLTQFDEAAFSKVRGGEIAMIFQEPMTSLNPAMRIGKQLEEAVKLHEGRLLKAQLKERALSALEDARLEQPERIYSSYPHELSGGMRQRVMIAMGTICRPGYLLCDEPTTALDVTTQKGIIELIERMRTEYNMGIIFITHDLKLLRNFADRVVVMCRGRVVEQGTVEDIFAKPKDEYTRQLIAAIPDRSRRIRVGIKG